MCGKHTLKKERGPIYSCRMGMFSCAKSPTASPLIPDISTATRTGIAEANLP